MTTIRGLAMSESKPKLKPELDDILSASRMVRNALRRGGPHALDAINSPPIYCYLPHADEIKSVLRLIFAMSPLRTCTQPYQIPDDPNPIFIYCADRPVPQEFWDHLKTLKALYLAVDMRHK